MKGLAKDFDAAHETLYGRELSGMEEGKEAYTTARWSRTSQAASSST